MSGAVEVAKDVAQVGAFPILAPAKAAVELVTKGKNPIRSIGESGRKAAGSAMDLVSPGLEGAGLVNNEPLPNIAIEDPILKAEEEKKQKARVKRQTQIDILTDKPGRGGTILTDNYTYNV